MGAWNKIFNVYARYCIATLLYVASTVQQGSVAEPMDVDAGTSSSTSSARDNAKAVDSSTETETGSDEHKAFVRTCKTCKSEAFHQFIEWRYFNFGTGHFLLDSCVVMTHCLYFAVLKLMQDYLYRSVSGLAPEMLGFLPIVRCLPCRLHLNNCRCVANMHCNNSCTLERSCYLKQLQWRIRTSCDRSASWSATVMMKICVQNAPQLWQWLVSLHSLMPAYPSCWTPYDRSVQHWLRQLID